MVAGDRRQIENLLPGDILAQGLGFCVDLYGVLSHLNHGVDVADLHMHAAPTFAPTGAATRCLTVRKPGAVEVTSYVPGSTLGDDIRSCR